MNVKSLLSFLVALGVLLPLVAGAGEPIKCSKDDKGTIHIKTGDSVEKEKGGKNYVEKTPGEPGTSGQVTGQKFTPGLPRHSPGAAAEARGKAFEQAHPNMIKQPEAQQPQPPAPQAPPTHSE